MLLVVKKWIAKIRSLFVMSDQTTTKVGDTGPKEISQSRSIFAGIVEPLMQPLMNLYPKEEKTFSEDDLPALEESLKTMQSEREFLDALIEGLTKLANDECMHVQILIHEKLMVVKAITVINSKISILQTEMINTSLRKLKIALQDYNHNEGVKLV